MDGQGVRKDVAVACQWLEKSARQGYSQAQYDLGICYARGRGVSTDLRRAYAWLTLADQSGVRKITKVMKKIAESMGAAEIAEAKKLTDKLRAGISITKEQQ